MELRTFQVDLDSIEEVNPQDLRFDLEGLKAELEYFAYSIIKLGGLLRIPVVERLGIDSYRIVEGHFDYYAYLKARELKPELPDRIRVFIMEKDNSEPIQTQLRVLKNISLLSNEQSIETHDSISLLSQLDSLKLFIETELSEIINVGIQRSLKHIELDLAKIKVDVAEIEKRISSKPEKIGLLSATGSELLNKLMEEGVKYKNANAAVHAIEYWKASGKELTWLDLKQSTKKGSHKIADFGETTYKKLQEIAEIK